MTAAARRLERAIALTQRIQEAQMLLHEMATELRQEVREARDEVLRMETVERETASTPAR
jgi:hypothetical protein